MININRIVSLNDILSESENVIFDTSTIAGTLKDSKDEDRNLNYRSKAEKEVTLINNLINYIDSDDYKKNIVLIPEVCNELLDKAEIFSQSRRERTNGKVRDSSYKCSYYNTIAKLKSKRRTLINLLGAKGRILNFTPVEDSLFKIFEKRYSFLKNKSFHGRWGNNLSLRKKLSQTDFNIVGSVWTLSNTSDKIALVSNDFPILLSLSYLFSKDSLRGLRVSSFIKIDSDQYSPFVSNDL